MAKLRNLLYAVPFTLASIFLASCATNDDYYAYRQKFMPETEQAENSKKAKKAFDQEDAADTETKSTDKSRIYLQDKNYLSDEYQKYDLSCKGVFDLGEDYQLIVYTTGSHTDSKGETANTYTNRADLDLRIGKYIKAGKNVLVYVETGARAEVFSYNHESEMEYWTLGGMLRTGLKVFDEKTNEQLTKIQLDAVVSGGRYDWQFSQSKLEKNILRVITQLKLNQHVLDINKIAKINFIAGIGYGNRDHRSYRRDQTVSWEGGIEANLDERLLGLPVKVGLFTGGRREFGQPYHHRENDSTYWNGGLYAEADLGKGFKVFLKGGHDGEKYGFVEGGLKLDFWD